MTTEERFWSKVDKSGECWLWTGTRTGSLGYGQFRLTSKRLEFAHRVAWWLAGGTIPKGMFVCHSCDTPPCVRPSHLFLGTPADNVTDMIAKGRRAKTRVRRLPPKGPDRRTREYRSRTNVA